MRALLAPLEEIADYNIIQDVISGGNSIHKKGVVAMTGCVDGQKIHLMAGLSQNAKYRVLVTYDEMRARQLWEEYCFYDRNAMFFPAKDLIFFQADIHGNQLIRERICTMRRLLEGKPLTIITTYAALMTPMVIYDREKVVLEVSKQSAVTTTGKDSISAKLVTLGYRKAAQVESPGQYAIRGDIIDVFDLTEENPYRIELWGDEVESIRSFDVMTQRSIENLESISIYPATEFVMSPKEISAGVEKICKDGEKQEEKLRKMFKTEEAHRLKKMVKELKEQLLELHGEVNLDSFIKYFYPEEGEGAHLAALPEQLLLKSGGKVQFYLEEPGRLKEQAEGVEAEFRASYSQRLEGGYILPGQADILYSGEEIAAQMKGGSVMSLSMLDGHFGYFTPDYKYDLGAKSIASYNGSFEGLVKDMGSYNKKKYKILLVSASRSRAKRLAEDLRGLDMPAVFSLDPDREIITGEVLVTYGRIARGFEYPHLRFVVLTEGDIFGVEQQKKKKRKVTSYQGEKISSLEDLRPGDYVVHETYGMGIYKGIEKVESGHVVRDYVKLEYRDGGNLFVLATELDSIQKYASSDAEKLPKLNKLGTKEWEHTKKKVRTAVEGVARDLVELYAKRQKTQGFQYGKDTVWQKEFEELFPYEETEDQKQAILDTKMDMESTKIMDRLICGDVGFGKTEIAIRAAFKAVQEGKQVAYLVPTTILAKQHFTTFTQRMKDFPVRVELMSRFRSSAELKQVAADLKKGLVDVVIGTHRLLSADVAYKDLGLLIIDEEQRFGVTHKEKIKKLKENVDVLTLSATPIPRTLHMSMVGIRDMSLLEEAPVDRLPIQTFVCEYDPQMVREAITRELSRGGQVFYVFNRVNMIADFTAQLQSMLPDVSIEYAHGQMPERQLENIMYDFVNGDIDVLVSTTIIETGMDIPNVNTLIIHESDRLGLSQLYQLRGRVGRSNRTAYAFLMYKKDKILSEVAEKRLGAIREFTDLGSGFKIAMRDLEIRGAGNLLGKTQSGHLESVGYEMYCKMLNEEVSKLKGIQVEEEFSTVINLDVDAYIPQEYIFNEEQKLDMYKRIASIGNQKEREDMRDELLDRFGEIPLPAENLLRIALIREAAHRLYMTEIKGREGRIIFSLKPDAKINPGHIPDLMLQYGKGFSFTPYGTPCFTYRYDREVLLEKEEQKLLELTEKLLADMTKLLLPAEGSYEEA